MSLLNSLSFYQLIIGHIRFKNVLSGNRNRSISHPSDIIKEPLSGSDRRKFCSRTGSKLYLLFLALKTFINNDQF